MRKIVALLCAIVMCIPLSACSSSTKTTSSSTGGKTPTDFQTFTIGVAEAQANDETVGRRAYLENYIAPHYNVKFIFSELLKDANAEISFIENCADSGANAIIDYKMANPVQMAQLCKDDNMIYVGNNSAASAPDLAQANPDNFYGFCGADQPACGQLFGDYLSKNASKDGSEGFLISSAIASSGNQQHMQVTEAALNALKNLYGLTYQKSVEDLAVVDAPTEVANDKGINIYIYPGSNTKDNWLPGISAVLQTGKYGFLISAGQSYTSSAVVVDEVERSFNKNIKVMSIAALGKSLTTAFQTKDKFGNSSLDLAAVKSTSLVSGGLFAMAYNALTGYGKSMRQTDGSAGDFSFKMWPVTSDDQLAHMNNWDNTDTGKWIADYDLIDSLLGIYHPDLTADQFKETLGSCTYENTLTKLG